ncbi:MAG: CBS domain-containing protein [Hyphomicrobiaceae bacterium]|nr:CBS domain-containing protein [Hyphomicrobiaceae bacterium]
MNVIAILKGKGKGVVTAKSGATLMQIAQDLAKLKIGAVVIVGDDGKVSGILSERDIIRVLALHGPIVLEKQVGEIMTRNVVTCSPADTLNELMQKMTDGRFRHLPVVDNGNLVGLISIGDIVKFHIAEVELEANAMRDYISH